MRKLTTFIVSAAFMFCGYFISINNHAFGIISSAKSARAAPMQVITPIKQYPRDLLLSHTNNVGTTMCRDTIHDTIPLEIRYDTIPIVKYKTKWKTKRVIVPDTVSRRVPVDTLYVSKPAIIIPVVKEEANDTTNLNAQ